MTATHENDPLAPFGQATERTRFRARIGSPIQIVTTRFGRTSHFASSVVGYVEHEYVIVKTPTEGGFSVPLKNGEYLKVRLFTGTHVVDFDTALLRQFGAPMYYWHLEYPDAVRSAALRAVPRTRVDIPALARIAGAQPSIEAQVIDLSAEGCQVIATQSLGEKDGVFALTLGIGQRDDGQAIELSVNARIRAIKALSGTGEAAPRWSYGVRFDDLDEHTQLRLENFILKRINDEPGEIV